MIEEKETVEKRKALESVLSVIERKFGKGSIMPLKNAEKVKVDVIPTGSLSLDIATGIGGIPKGRIIEIFGPESSGKTTLALHVIASAQRMGGVAVFIDAEHALDPKYAEKIGVNTESLYISQPDYGEQALEIVESLVASNAVDVIVVDSVAALVPKDELEGEMGEAHVGKQARLMSQALRKLKGMAHKANTAIIFINQLREKIGVMFGNPETTPGGRALKFFADMRLDVRKVGDIKDSNDKVGNRVRVKVVKNKLAPPFQEAEFDVIYGEGICKLCDLIDIATELKVLNRSGAWYSYGELKLGQGKDQVKKFLMENPELAGEIEQKVREVVGLAPADT
ncbi:recA protein [Hydrogenobacter thermophilus TK-6]|uniref:Protein RecA n=1 Tax=Hydrogenobacter thermophilus (strain DSM 6534 / IAM 12695 / TK-6) TaxID=608538 RepID=D3DHE7_HYDTT|nr:recombinase RecA [Hydrogenobacter thermophilus]ADO45186.1 recA protein [Hydrogenobacter thermophilus TK-6]BAI69249.1 RecA protein [Hydrogenobacter thermophilus TK-6]